MRRLAIRSALSGKVADGELVVIDELAFETPKTQEMIRIFENVGIERSVLVVTAARTAAFSPAPATSSARRPSRRRI